MSRIERYDILLNKFDEFKVRLQVPVYGCFVVPVNESKILIGGGFNSNNGNSDKVYTVDTHSGQINYLNNLSNPSWSVLAPVYMNGALHFFSCGEESDNTFPEEIKYSFNVPI